MSLEQSLADNTAAVNRLVEVLAKQSAIAHVPAPAAESVGKSIAAANTAPAAASTPPTEEASAAPAAKAENSAPVSYDDLKKVFFDYVNTKGVPAAQAWLKAQNLLPEGKTEYHLTGAKPEQYAALRDDLLKLKAA